MKLKNTFLTLVNQLASQKLWKIQLASLILVAVIPILFLSINLYRMAWENAWQEITEKHQLLATNMSAPIENYVEDHRAMLKVIANGILVKNNQLQNIHSISKIINSTIENFKGYKAIALINDKGQTQYLNSPNISINNDLVEKSLYQHESCFLKTRVTLKPIISNIKTSPLDQTPTIILSEPIVSKQGILVGELLAELKIDGIEALRKKIHFGKMGHSAIVDAKGHVIAHPNPVWMKEMKDLSDWKIVQDMIAGKTGVTEFYSPFIKANMVAGYTSIPKLGWGIMVPQPKSEIAAQVNKVMLSNLTWAIVGLLFAIGLAWVLVQWITRPIMRLSTSAQQLTSMPNNKTNEETTELLSIKNSAPKEIQDLSLSLNVLFHNLQAKHKEVEQLNQSLQDKVLKATEKLQLANQELEKMTQSDHLTSLASRRYFMDCLTDYTQSTGEKRKACALLIDLDNFKDINDSYGHNAGDAILIQIGDILKTMGQKDDVFARYGGDEFSAILFSPLEDAVKCAEKLRSTIESTDFIWQKHLIKMTVSIGLLEIPTDNTENILTIIEKVDNALYEGKKSGRNTIIEYKALPTL